MTRIRSFVQQFPRGQKTQVSRDGGAEPEWSPDGRELYFVAADGRLMAATISAQPRLTSSPAQPLFEVPYRRSGDGGRGRDYDVFPDGSGFVMVEHMSERAAPTSVRIVTGWFEEAFPAPRQ